MEIEAELEELEEDKVRLSEELIEKNREALAWEKKLKLTLETKDNINEEKSGELGNIKAEIHRMNVNLFPYITFLTLFHKANKNNCKTPFIILYMNLSQIFYSALVHFFLHVSSISFCLNVACRIDVRYFGSCDCTKDAYKRSTNSSSFPV